MRGTVSLIRESFGIKLACKRTRCYKERQKKKERSCGARSLKRPSPLLADLTCAHSEWYITRISRSATGQISKKKKNANTALALPFMQPHCSSQDINPLRHVSSKYHIRGCISKYDTDTGPTSFARRGRGAFATAFP